MSKGHCYQLVFLNKGHAFTLCFSEDLFHGFLSDPAYFDRFSFFNETGGDGVGQPEEAFWQRIEGLFGELIELKNTKLDTSIDLIKVVMLQLLITIEETKREYLSTR